MKKKVLFVVHHLTIGGAQKSLITALRYFDYEKYDVTLYVRKNRLALLDFIDSRVNVIVNEDRGHYYLKPCAFILQILILISKLFGLKSLKNKFDNKLKHFILTEPMKNERKRYFNNLKYDIAIAFMHGASALFVSDYVEAEKKIVRYCVSTDENHEIHEKVFGKINSIICVSDGVKEAVTAFYPQQSEKIRVIENIVDSEYVLKSSEEFKVERNENELILCCIGRFSEVKGMDFAVEAARILKENEVSFKWFLIGDGPEAEKLKNMVRINNLGNDVVFTGMINNPYPYLKACDIFVLPSRAEALSNALLEAYAVRKPVVSTLTVCGKNSVTDGKTGVLTDICAEGVAAGIMKLINDNDLRTEILNNLESEDNTDVISRYKEQWREVLEEL